MRDKPGRHPPPQKIQFSKTGHLLPVCLRNTRRRADDNNLSHVHDLVLLGKNSASNRSTTDVVDSETGICTFQKYNIYFQFLHHCAKTALQNYTRCVHFSRYHMQRVHKYTDAYWSVLSSKFLYSIVSLSIATGGNRFGSSFSRSH